MSENTQNQNAEQTAAEKAAAPKLTRAEKIAKRVKFLFERITADTAEYNDLSNEINNAEALKNLAVGQGVKIKQGRKFADKDTTRIVDAKIIGSAVQEDGSTLYKVSFGEGFNADVAVISAGAILSVVASEVVEEAAA